MNAIKNVFRILAVTLLVVLLSAAPAAARREKPTGDRYRVPQADDKNPTIPALYLFVGLAGIGVIAFKSSRRSRAR